MSSGAFENAFDYNWAGPPLYFAMVWCVFVWAGRFATARPQLLAPPKFVIVGFWMGTGGLFLGQAVRTVFGWFGV